MNRKNISLVLISIIVFVLICLIVFLYYINNLMPKKISIDNNVEVVQNDGIFEVESIEQGKIFSKITIKKKLDEKELKKYTNYTLGSGQDYYLNYAIVLSNNKKSYKVKTIIEDRNPSTRFDKKDEDGFIHIKGIFLNKSFFKERYDIEIIQEDYKENYKNMNKINYKNIGVIGKNYE